MSSCDLASKECEPCKGGIAPMTPEEIDLMMPRLQGWTLSDDKTSLRRRFAFKGFLKAVEMANLAAWLGNKQGHHPDIAFGWGYCEVTFTTHEAGGLTENDFICAARLDALVA
ncbi:4a-hydroxytetrahydrobiopterin dehydratase [Paracoccus seriniphilus]|uniref:Putative pterin-4-alpha-carbinolamine dehydratase n=2 Tax=Paracoccus seriniphilus TaxID=184748 RepID=A0A239PLK4_9RHOB|nr:4a-hydroxytetrahydrobiopterin dehydratase [Paracoccus seriniphilus]SNT68682.1 pterin-4-alpha-carbinolamine dehydratase [Paracoccus seriniphilus]